MWKLHLLGKTKIVLEKRVSENTPAIQISENTPEKQTYENITPLEALLLCELALAPERSLSREELKTLLWDEDQEDYPTDPGHCLSQMLSNFKAKLVKSLSYGELLQVKKDTVALHPDLWIDVTEFKTAIRTARKAANPDAEEMALTQAISVYGGKLLPQHPFSFGDEREQLHEQYLEAQKRLAQLSALSVPPVPVALSPVPAPLVVSFLPPRSPVKPTRKRARQVVTWVGLGIAACGIWLLMRPRTVPESPVKITAANLSSVRSELNLLRTGVSTAETQEAQTERQNRHAELYTLLLETADQKFWGPEESIWQEALQTTAESQKTAFNWCLEHDPEKALQISGVLAAYKSRVGINNNDGQEAAIKDEARRLLDDALARSKDRSSLFRARALRRYALVAYDNAAINHTNRLVGYARQSRNICQQQGQSADEAEACRMLALATAAQDRQREALELYKQTAKMYHRLNDKTGEARTYLNMARLGGLGFPKPMHWTCTAEWAQRSLHLFRAAQSQYGIQNAWAVYQKTVALIDPRFAKEKAQWQKRLLADCLIEVQRAETDTSNEAVSLRKTMLRLAVEVQDDTMANAQMLWFYRHWNRTTSLISEKTRAQLDGWLMHRDSVVALPFSQTERQRLNRNRQWYLSQPPLRAAFEAGSTMHLKDAANVIAEQP